ncbi:DUF1800 domain-containing protein [Silvimonas sp.]|uniref:DUF1800 domain-containing protein n=1 Tax=Silvimonas sp. TaxID=2650811 RepID=UPI0028523916|nr:DUF1800 domain-containing protein [Silvimonas sp.]MDR3427236.1 DUF1800 domain-containing protein [Silvimonas sp.]
MSISQEDASPGVETDVDHAGFDPLAAMALAAGAALLSACGGGGGGSSDTVAAAPTPSAAPVTSADASRLLSQAGFGASDDLLSQVQTQGTSAWLDAQMALPTSQGHYDWMVANGYNVVANLYSSGGIDNSLWHKLISSPDVLRQRMVLAYSEIFVVSLIGLPIAWPQFTVAAYVDLLEANAFGTYRQLLQAVALSVGMGSYLNMRGNQKGNPATGRQPDENFAREVMQLMSIGLYLLNPDGSLQLDGQGQPIPTYDQTTITTLASVFTGWDAGGANNLDPAFVRTPMVNTASRHDSTAKSLLGINIAAGTDAATAMGQVLDALASHQNTAPFISRQLIQRLVCSNPSPAYIQRVATVFANNGAGVRGDLKAVIKAILLDTEARATPDPANTTSGKLREPVIRFVQWARTFNATTATGKWGIGDLSDPASKLGMSPLRSPSVFNFFRPGYVPPDSQLGTLNLTSPELQITNESTVVGYINFMQNAVTKGVADVVPGYSAELLLAVDANALVQRYALLLACNGLSADTVATITTAVSSISTSTSAGQLARVQAAILLVMVCPEYLVQK